MTPEILSEKPRIEIYCGDCLEIMKSIPDKSIDLVLTDPPYELDNHGGGNTEFAQRKLVKDLHIDFISNSFNMEVIFGEFERICNIVNILVFCSNKQLSKIMSYWENKGYSTTCLMWKKPNPIPFCNGKYVSDCEFIIYSRGKKAIFMNLGVKELSKFFEYSVPSSQSRNHPTEKPINLIKHLLKIHSITLDTVLDPFMGSGTTLVAAKELGRNAIGIEISETYYNIAKRRILQATTELFV